ncbi:hypothetical protein [Streptomyces sp. RPA4-5]|uniref:hypothetical protein n=1 Tax=Streptomyces sp. RPA4-5 TaxID=2721245 RepID=UPI002001E506
MMLGRHCGLSRVVENFCLEMVQGMKAQQEVEKTYGITGDDLTRFLVAVSASSGVVSA